MRKIAFIHFICLVALSLFTSFSARAEDTEEDGRYWFNVNATGPMPLENWRWYAAVSYTHLDVYKRQVL